MNPKISAVINTYNEEHNIEGCLQCLIGQVDEIIVSDMNSTDRTREIAERYTDKVFIQPKVDVVEQGRANAVKHANNSWVLVLDADERVAPSLIVRLREIAGAENCVAISIPRINYIFGMYFTEKGFPRERFARFFQKDKMHFSEKVHSWGEIEGNVCTLPDEDALSIHHYSNPTVYEFVRKINIYTEDEARHAALAIDNKIPMFRRLILRPVKIFFTYFLKNKGYRNGRAGMVWAVLMAFYWVLVACKIWSLQEGPGRGNASHF